MIRTRVGYAGGTTESPTYHSIGDHSEATQIDFDPQIISFEELVEIFWASHVPTSAAYSVQYRNALFYENEEQREIAERARGAVALELATRLTTSVEPLGTFTRAEDYHQKYYLRNNSLLFGELSAYYPEVRAFVDSTSAARINGYLGGNGSMEQLEGELESLGVSDEAEQLLLDQVHETDINCGT